MFKLLLLAVVSISLEAGGAEYSGTGCPEGSLSIATSPDQTAVTVLFDRFTLEAGGNSARKQDRKECRIEIPVQVPQGMRVAVTRVDYRGFISLPAQAHATLSVRNAFKGNSGPGVNERFRGEMEQEFSFSTPSQMKWSPCGGLDEISVVTQATLHSNKELAVLTLDSQDSSSTRGFIYHLEWKKCGR
jgi:hypothetical protein